jgi:hypothetical protein
MPLADWIAKYPRVQALLTRPDDVLDYRPDHGRDPLPESPEPPPTEGCCGYCGERLTPHECEINRTRLMPIHAEAVATGWPFPWKPICTRCFHED